MSTPFWLRISLGCMRLSTDGDRDEERAQSNVCGRSGAPWCFVTTHLYADLA
jgi:hypothetical protein